MSTTPKTLTVEESNKLLGTLLDLTVSNKKLPKAIRNYTMAVLMLDAGLRVGELVRLRGHHLYFNSRPVTSIIISPDIAEKRCERQIPVSVRLSDALKMYGESLTTYARNSSHYYVFHTTDSYQPLTTRQVERIIRTASIRALGRPIHPHVLRHTFASNLMRVTNIRTVQELLGHKNVSSTQIYTHPNEEDKVKAIACMQEGCFDTTEDLEKLRRAAHVANRPDAP